MSKIKRMKRYGDYAQFVIGAEKQFKEYLGNDNDARNISESHSFYVHNHSAGNIVKVHFGNTIIYSKNKNLNLDQKNQNYSVITESGASLQYQMTNTGTVICSLFPAKTEESSPIESSILLEWITNPESLLLKKKTEGHWRYFISYMHCTSIDGEPTIFDKLRIEYLKLTRRLVVNGKAEEIRIFTSLKKIFGYVVTVGLSGFLLLLITNCSSQGKVDPLRVIISLPTAGIQNIKTANKKDIINKGVSKATEPQLQDVLISNTRDNTLYKEPLGQFLWNMYTYKPATLSPPSIRTKVTFLPAQSLNGSDGK